MQVTLRVPAGISVHVERISPEAVTLTFRRDDGRELGERADDRASAPESVEGERV